MEHYELNGVIQIVQEKKLNNIPSKGRNQWEVLKQFNGETVSSFVEAAKAKTRNSPPGTFQESNWWERELAWNLERNNIAIRD